MKQTKRIIAVICIAVFVALLITGCNSDAAGDGDIDATREITGTYQDNNGEFDWNSNDYTSVFPKPETGNITQYLINTDEKYCSVIIDNTDLEITKSYIDLLEENNVSTAEYQIYDEAEYPVLNYLGKLSGYNISISQSDDNMTVIISVNQ